MDALLDAGALMALHTGPTPVRRRIGRAVAEAGGTPHVHPASVTVLREQLGGQHPDVLAVAEHGALDADRLRAHERYNDVLAHAAARMDGEHAQIAAAAAATGATIVTCDPAFAAAVNALADAVVDPFLQAVYVPALTSVTADAAGKPDSNRGNDDDAAAGGDSDPGLLEWRAAGLANEISELLDLLDARVAEVLKIRFGLDRGRARTLAETGAHFGLDPARIRQIEQQALRTLRERCGTD